MQRRVVVLLLVSSSVATARFLLCVFLSLPSYENMLTSFITAGAGEDEIDWDEDDNEPATEANCTSIPLPAHMLYCISLVVLSDMLTSVGNRQHRAIGYPDRWKQVRPHHPLRAR